MVDLSCLEVGDTVQFSSDWRWTDPTHKVACIVFKDGLYGIWYGNKPDSSNKSSISNWYRVDGTRSKASMNMDIIEVIGKSDYRPKSNRFTNWSQQFPKETVLPYAFSVAKIRGSKSYG